VITFACDKCRKSLEVDDDLAGQKVECPFCADVNLVPSRRVARPASGGGGGSGSGGGNGGAKSAGASSGQSAVDRPSEMGLPPDSGPEQHVIRVHPAMFRARPLRALLAWLLVIGGVVLFFVGAPLAGAGPIVGGVLVGAGLLWLAVWWVQTRTVALIITNKRTTLRRGILSRETSEMLHDRIQDIQITQSFLQRIWKVGRIGISSSGESGIEIDAQDLPDPVRLREIIDAYRNV
jgi:membrane protein YdbS with pleckstrin-like domain